FLFDRRQFHLFEEDRRSDDGRRRRSASGAIVDGGNIARGDDFSQTPHIHRAELAAPDGLFASVGDINLVNRDRIANDAAGTTAAKTATATTTPAATSAATATGSARAAGWAALNG